MGLNILLVLVLVLVLNIGQMPPEDFKKNNIIYENFTYLY
ncbi:hypothetical protein EV214_10146 [Marinisporobacter balticus]|uniref:Uncharacterized protein n=1 Tax=Marinisporobacter balticus TaxID=2018667 RepID=A0A4R2L741_9FIRM|nr:hypothetical protein EV214_10146 [Marinisporobacter balticus]